jgi:hypothetical protein
VYARKVILRHALVAANIFADEVDIEDCVVVGGVFATKRFASKDSLVGTFNSPEAMLSGRLILLLPACFTTEPLQVSGDLKIENLALADLASMYFGAPVKPRTGAIELDPRVDTIESELTDQQGNRMKVKTLTVAGRALLAGLSDLEGLGNQYLAAAVGLGPHLLKRFSLEQGEVDPEKVAGFFFDILHGKVQFKKMDASIPMDEIRRMYG